MSSGIDSTFTTVEVRGETFRVSALPERSGDGGLWWWVLVDDGQYRITEARASRLDDEARAEIERWLDIQLQLRARGPSRLANYDSPLRLDVDGRTVLCRAHLARGDEFSRWSFECQDRRGGQNVAQHDDTIGRVRQYAREWLKTEHLTD